MNNELCSRAIHHRSITGSLIGRQYISPRQCDRTIEQIRVTAIPETFSNPHAVRGQNLVWPKPKLRGRGRGQDYKVEAEAKNNYEKVANND